MREAATLRGSIASLLPWAPVAGAAGGGPRAAARPAASGTAPPADRDAEAKALFQAGRAAYDAGRFEDALGHFQRAYELSGRTALLYDVALAADRARRDDLAIAAYEGQECCAGACAPAGCEDGNSCTSNACGASGCVSSPDTGTPCADDGDPCTTDVCGAGGSCEHPAVSDATPCGGTNRCSGGQCVAMNTAEHCGSWNIRCAAGRSCIPVPDAPSHYTCTCLGFADCQPNGFGGSATCHTDASIGKTYCLCQCGAVGTCAGQCADGYLCYDVAGDDYCAP